MSQTDFAKDKTAIFLPENEREDAHIVDVLIEERCPSFVSHWSWPFVRPMLYKALGYNRAVRMADYVKTVSGWESFDHLAGQLEMKLTLRHLERMPATGKLILAVNHPTGLADGIALWSAITRVRRDIQIFANADAIRVSENMVDTIIPVEWVVDKRTAGKTKETLRRANMAFERDECVVIFPSGKLAGKENGQMVERPWFPTVVSLARKQKCAILPVNIRAENSRLYYLFSRLNGELRDITLFYELLNKKGAGFDMTFGPLIPPDDLAGDVSQVTERLKNYVAYDLPENPSKPFSEYSGGSETV